ncbi:hypothetical protein Clacol_004505 [Clathrus columnatus]|uniref:Uncharacterized protein n=1 Tax=Clathrus columnatus TaxID=1419009 RepID=A0AAV5AAM4_9AGAM|nr:hypothetical protein Clacol_004505 [Clathrus columnatus]
MDFVSIQQDPHATHHPVRRKILFVSTQFECVVFIAHLPIYLLVQNITVILSDALAFLAVIRQVWGLWKEKRRLHLQTGNDFVTLLLQQGILRFSLSTILICEFTLDLRRRNTTARSLPNQSALELPDLNLSSQNNSVVRPIQAVLGRLQERIIADMGEMSDSVGIEGLDQLEGEPDPETA